MPRPIKNSLYPFHPPGTTVLVQPPTNLSAVDRYLVYLSSLLIMGSAVWLPALTVYVVKKYRRIPRSDKKKRVLYGSLLLSFVLMAVAGPHRSKRLGSFLKIRNWRLWQAWLNYIAFEVVTDCPIDDATTSNIIKERQALLAIIPHGVFPFSVAFSALPQIAQRAFGIYRPVVATATNFFPFVNTVLKWIGAVDASRSSVHAALAAGDRIGIAPGGIGEMFEGYPKARSHPDDECALLQNRKGFLRMAVRHQVPVIPVYCFGASKMMRRLNLPLLEKISKVLRFSVCVFYGRWGLPVPFSQRLLYVVGRPIVPPPLSSDDEDDLILRQQVDEMHEKFCEELLRMFDKFKGSYGWDHKILRIT